MRIKKPRMNKKIYTIIFALLIIYSYFTINMWIRFREVINSAMEYDGYVTINFNRYGEMFAELIIINICFFTSLIILGLISIMYVRKMVK